MATQQSAVVTLSEAESSNLTAFSFLAAWVIALIILYFIAQTRAGEVVIYDALVLLIVLILVRNYQSVVGLLSPITGIIPSGGNVPAANPTGVVSL